MDPKQRVKISRSISQVLRHDPGRVGLQLDPGGWVGVDELLKALAAHGNPLSRADLEEIVATSDKQRFGIAEDKIRANQGHSIEVDLGLVPKTPPPVLYHGTGAATAAVIQASGISKMSRQQVHLSADTGTATRVGARHGRPVIFGVRAADLHAAGGVFFESDNHVWLIEQVPPEYLWVIEPSTD